MQHFRPRLHLYNKGFKELSVTIPQLESLSRQETILRMFTQPTLYFGIMNGHHKISISGVVFYVEESCRNLLMNHLKWIHRNNTSPGPGNAEERVAEILLDELREGSEVITCQEVNHLIEKTSTT